MSEALLHPSLWGESCLSTESSLHQLAPYIGKMKSSMAKALIERYSSKGDLVCDPFVGSGVVALESLIGERGILASDISPYAYVLTKAKLAPPLTMEEALSNADFYCTKMKVLANSVALRTVPKWVRSFFHPRTLKEIIALSGILRQRREYFLLACLLGILHHQRPGFLSYPASHLVPYLRTKNFPEERFPEMYKYRSVVDRLKAKINRVYKRFPRFSPEVPKECRRVNAATSWLPKGAVDVVITSPPYMNALDYARDNRLRLWFLGVADFESQDRKVPNNPKDFLILMERCMINVYKGLKRNAMCVLVIGEVGRSHKPINTAQLIIEMMKNRSINFRIEEVIEDTIPDIRRARRNGSCTKKEWIVVFKKVGEA
jgi:DNA modification methylase